MVLHKVLHDGRHHSSMPPLILLHLPLGLPLLLSEKGVNILWFHRQCDAVGEVPPQFRRVTRVGRVVMLGQTTVEESQGVSLSGWQQLQCVSPR